MVRSAGRFLSPVAGWDSVPADSPARGPWSGQSPNRLKKKPRSGPVSRVLFLAERGDGHSSRTPIARRLEQPTRESIANRTDSRQRRRRRLLPVWSCSGWGLPSQPSHLGCWCALTAPFHPYLIRTVARRGHRRCVFCGTFPSLAAGRRYRPPCPAEPGLSSRRRPPCGSHSQRPSGPLRDP